MKKFIIRYRSFFERNKVLICLGFLATLVSNFLTIFIALLLGKYFELLTSESNAKSKLLSYIPAQWTQDFNTFFIFFGLIIFLKLFFLYTSRLWVEKAGIKFLTGLRKYIFTVQLNLPIEEYLQNGGSKYLVRFSGDMQTLKLHLTNGILYAAGDLLLGVLIIIVLFSINSWIGVMTVSFLALIYLLLIPLNKKVYSSSKNKRNKQTNLLGFVNSSMTAVKSIVVHQLKNDVNNKFSKLNTRYQFAYLDQNRFDALYKMLVPGFAYLLLFIILYYLTSREQVFVGNTIIVTILLINSLSLMKRILSLGGLHQKAKLSWESIARLEEKLIKEKDLMKIKKSDLRYINLSVKDKRIRLRNGFNAVHYHSADNLTDAILGIKKSTGVSFSFTRETQGKFNLIDHIAVIDRRYTPVANSLKELFTYQTGLEIVVKIEELIADINMIISEKNHLSFDMLVGDNGKALNKLQFHLVSLGRAFLSQKKFIIVNIQPDTLSKSRIQNYKKFIDKHCKDAKILFVNPTPIIEMLFKNNEVEEDYNNILKIV